MKNRWIAAALVAALVAVVSAPASARARIVQLGVKDRAPAAGQHIELQVALLAADAAGVRAGHYSVQVELRNGDGAQIGASNAILGTDDVTSERAAILVVPLDLPQGIDGTVQVQAILSEDGAVVDRSDPQGLVIGGVVVAPAGQPAAAAAPSAFALSGSLTNNVDVSGNAVGRSSLLSLDGKLTPDLSFSGSGGATTSTGGNKPLLSFRTKQSQTQLGTFAPSFDPMVFDGPNGLAMSYRAAPDDKHALQAAFVSGANGTANPFQVGAASIATLIGRASTLTATAGAYKVDGDADPGSSEPIPDNGTFLGLAFGRDAGGSIFGYMLRYGLQAYRDKTGRALSGGAFAATANLTIKKTAWTFDYRRASPNYANLLAPGVTPDRETAKLNVSVPFGIVTSTIGIQSDADDLPGASLAQRSRAVTENLSLNLPLKNGASLAYSFNGSTTHLGADLLVSPTAQNVANAGDGQNIAYNMKSGDYTFGYTLGYTNQRDNSGNMQHVTQNGVTVARSVTKGLTFSSNLSLNTSVAANSASSTSGLAANLSLGYVLGPAELSGSFGTSRNRPYLGLRPPDSSNLNLGLKLAQSKNLTVQGGFTQSTSGPTTQSGTINVTQKL
jgi:hypothetical protein